MMLNYFYKRFMSKQSLTAFLCIFFSPFGHTVSNSDFTAIPPSLSDTAKPLVMLAIPKDHQLFYKAYTDYDDLDQDGFVESTYTHSIDYAGYFDATKCYTYNATNGRFVPASLAANKYCNTGGSSGQWSGNFLNWATMTRMDEVRKVLYGGYRSTDTASLTVLERSYLPNEAHSFAKYYNGTDFGKLTPFTSTEVPTINQASSVSGFTICNTTDIATGVSTSVNTSIYPPRMKVVHGNYSLWAAGERFQCLYSNDARMGGGNGVNGNTPGTNGLWAYGDSPPSSAQVFYGTVRVEACKTGLVGNETCKTYPNGNLKPIGLLQEFGDNEQIWFGLMTGTYGKNISGGVLRKDISSFTNEINITSDGTFKAAPSTGGIINTLNLLRLINYQHNNGLYNDCLVGQVGISNGVCRSWGSPLSEMLMECYRYFGGHNKTNSFDFDDSSILSGLTRQTNWNLPLSDSNKCASLNVIAFNASISSYDGNELGPFSDLGIAANTATNAVGTGEGINGNSFFIGNNGTTNDGLCTLKTVTNLGDIGGVCPEAPSKGGSFAAAGMAHYSKVKDINTNVNGEQNVTTYGVALSPAVPKVKLTTPNGNKSVTILPACRNTGVRIKNGADLAVPGEKGSCSLIDFKEIKPPTVNGNTIEGSFFVVWDVHEWGSDHDQDINGVLTYSITNSKLTVTTDVFRKSSSRKTAFGYVLSGTTQDGFHAQSGINGYIGSSCTTACYVNDASASKAFNLGGSGGGGLLEQPLYYAAKWGGFNDIDGDANTNGHPTPNLTQEWDALNNTTGAQGADGIPDNYFLAINPGQLTHMLRTALSDILVRTSAGSAVAVVANTGSGEGALFQALYNPAFREGDKQVNWVGNLNAILLDKYGNLREDNTTPGQISSGDYIVEIAYDPALERTMVRRFTAQAGGTKGSEIGTASDLSTLKTLWSARDSLAAVSNFVTQRSYSTSASTGRHIITAVDGDGNGMIDSAESVPFTATEFDTSANQKYRLLGLDSTTKDQTANIVNFIRGQEGITDFRSRTINYDKPTNTDTTEEPWLLGDIVHSSPQAVGKPSAAYDSLYGDNTYATFKQAYNSRRQVVYVGANDGMLHAFNSGFFNIATSTYDLTTADGETSHPLGSELWAYVPYNLLPHLQWLTSEQYQHVYYVDGAPQVYDVNIFKDDADHPKGWGTILVVGARFGGGDFTLDPNSDDDGSDADNDDITLRSSFTILDITNPEVPPKVLAEITDADLGYTLSEPTLVKFRKAGSSGTYNNPSINDWFLVFGSGPVGSDDLSRANALEDAVSNKTAKVYALKLNDLVNKSSSVAPGNINLVEIDSGESNSFIGGAVSADWNRDYQDDAIYFGTVGGTVAAPTGDLKRGKLSLSSGSLSISIADLLTGNVAGGQPFSATPTVYRDTANDYWVYAGTGRFYVADDNLGTQQQTYYGIKDPSNSSGALAVSSVSKADLINTSGLVVNTNGDVRSETNLGGSSVTLNNGDVVESFAGVKNSVAKEKGWYFDLRTSLAAAKNTTSSVLVDQSLVFTEYLPSGLQCEPEGQGYLNAPHFQAGIPAPFAPVGTNPNVTFNSAEQVNMGVFLGRGVPSEPKVFRGADGSAKVIIQMSTGEVGSQSIGFPSTQGKRQSWREIPITW